MFGPLANPRSVGFVPVVAGLATLVVAAVALIPPSCGRVMSEARTTGPLASGSRGPTSSRCPKNV
jgi:hypothetical protein